MELNYKNLASAYLKVLEGYDFVIPEDVPANERTAFHGAAAAAHKAGKSHFDFGGKKYPVTMKKDVAKAINSEVQKEAKEDEPKASSEVDGDDEKDSEAKKVPCPKCEGKGCAHCDMKGYHMSKVENKVTEGHMDGMCCKNCGDMFGQPTEGSCQYDAYDPKGKNWIKAEKQHESVDEDVNFVPHSNCPCGDDCNCDPCTCAEVKEEAQLDEISRTMTPMKNRFGGTVDPKKFDKYKKHMKTHKLDEPTVRMIHQNPDDAESKRMMKNPKYAQAVGLYKASMKKEEVEKVAEISQDKLRQYHGKAGADLQAKRDKVTKGELSMADLKKGQNRVKGLNRSANKMEEKKLTPKEIKRALASIKPPKKKPTLPKAPFEIPKENTLPAPKGGKKSVRSADKRPVNVNVDGKTVTRMEPVTKRTAAAYESVNRENWLDALQNKKLQEAEDAKTKMSKPTGLHHSDDATRDTYDKQLSTRKGEQDFVKMHDVETPEYADVNRVLPKTFAAFTAGVKAGGGKTNDAPGDKGPVKSGK